MSRSDERQLDRIERLLIIILHGVIHMSASLDALEAQVTANTSTEESAVTLIKGIADQLAAAQADPAKIADLSARLHASADALAAAIVANTPAAAPPV